ncbi:MAG: glycoside hydrolase family 18 protein [Spirochaetales bacterium]
MKSFPATATAWLLALLVLVSCQTTPQSTAGPTGPSNFEKGSGVFGGKRISAYYSSSNVYKKDYQVADIPAANLTHIFYAFMKIDPATKTIALYDENADIVKKTGNEPAGLGYRGSFAQLYLLKQKNPQLHLIASVGGGTQSDQFSDMAASAKTRKAFADSVVVFLKKYSFDGVDLDWEFPVEGGGANVVHSPKDKANLTLLLSALRTALDASSKADSRTPYELGLTVSPNPAYGKNLEIGAIAKLVDFLNLMTYDYHGAWDDTTNHLAPLYADPESPEYRWPSGRKLNVDGAVQYYLENGVPAAKLNVGIPMYGVAWQVPAASPKGLFVKEAAGAQIDKSVKTGIVDYASVQQLVAKGLHPFWDEASHASYLWDKDSGLFVSYDDNRSTLDKLDYVIERKLGGVMFWELSQDRGGDLLNLTAWSLKRQVLKALGPDVNPAPTVTTPKP